MTHQGSRTLETERLTLRAFRASDGESMYRNWAGDPEVTRFLTWPTHESQAVSESLCQKWEERSNDPSFYQWAIVPKALGEPIGSISAVKTDEATQSAEIGYCIGKKWWHQGYTSEALRAVIAYMFDQAGFFCIRACHDVNNPNSGRVMASAGMKKDGVVRAFGRNNTGICDIVFYSILRDEYLEQKAISSGAAGKN
ncbi:MAG: GNAT family N-acetyltransferase [Clostridia bacterium]|nr:GNAT family N-acetyltransferase [Clostridia bacterium]